MENWEQSSVSMWEAEILGLIPCVLLHKQPDPEFLLMHLPHRNKAQKI